MKETTEIFLRMKEMKIMESYLEKIAMRIKKKKKKRKMLRYQLIIKLVLFLKPFLKFHTIENRTNTQRFIFVHFINHFYSTHNFVI